MVKKGASVGFFIERPARGMNYATWMGLRGINFPQFFNANGIALRIFARIQCKFLYKLTTKLAARTFRKDGVACVKFNARLIVRRMSAVFCNPHIASGHPFYGAAIGVEDFSSSKARKHINF